MPHARLTHPSRPTLEFRQSQQDEDARQAVASIAPQLGLDEPPFVHVTTRERSRSIEGRVTAPRRAQNDADTSDWEQALANYIDRLEAHCDEFQGADDAGYTFVDDVLNESLNAVYTGVEWRLQGGQPYDIQFSLDVQIGKPIFESRAIDRENPTVDTGTDIIATVGGHDLPGLREMAVTKEIGFEVAPIYNRSSAEDNVVVPQQGRTHEFVIRGTHTGSRSTRRTADANLDALIGQQDTTLDTRFPGYSKTGVVLQYTSNFQASFGTRRHDYTLRFIEATGL